MKKLNEYFSTLYDLSGVRTLLSVSVQKEFQKSVIRNKNSLKFVLCAYYKDGSAEFILKLKEKSKVKSLLPIEKYKSSKTTLGTLSLLSIEVKRGDLGVPPSIMKKKISKEERGLTLIEGLWTALYIPSLLSEQAVDLINDRYGVECVPTIYSWRGKLYLSAICPDVSDKMCGAPIVKKEITLKKVDFSDSEKLAVQIRSLRNS